MKQERTKANYRCDGIPSPDWARETSVSVADKFGHGEYERLSVQRQEVLDTVQRAVQQYVNDDALTSDGDDGLFPQRQKLTSEYYISGEHYWVYTEQRPPHRGERQYRFSLMTRCLEKPRHENQQDSDADYLGLEVHFEWQPDEQTVVFYGDVVLKQASEMGSG